MNHAGKEMKLKEAKIWELLNIPIGSLLLFYEEIISFSYYILQMRPRISLTNYC